MSRRGTSSPSTAKIWGLLAEFPDPSALVAAAETVRRAGYRRFDTHSPFPIHGIARAMGIRGSWVPFTTLAGGLTGGLGALALQYWIHVVDYPIVISGKPFFSLPAFIPVTFELTVLLASFGAVGGMLLFNLLPMLYHPLLKCASFARATRDGFFLSIEARDPKFDLERTRRELEAAGARHIELVEP